jgi:hypothetical protein
MVRKGLDCDKKILCVIWSYSGTVLSPLSGYDEWRLRLYVFNSELESVYVSDSAVFPVVPSCEMYKVQ